ncbi:MAG: YraN family protein [Candidatus Margulisbacteria bacterium]|nr:YraN family protein [Candidatus Margulisiibacteriota bacterium]MBU1617405.1 YraN family protein [Candidatus Margulisiibacteriota bacterium]
MASYLLGVNGESIAEEYYMNQGYEILAKNFRSHQGEIDIVVRRDSLLVFVEVKNYSYKNLRHPAAAISKNKKENLIRTARYYLYINKIKETNCRFDVLTIIRRTGEEPVIEQYENAFEVTGC